MAEKAELQKKYDDCKKQINLAGTLAVANDFEIACQKSVAVSCTTLEKLMPVASGRYDTFSDFYQTSDLLCRTDPDEWGIRRKTAETFLLAVVSNDPLHYATLTLTDQGLPYYGDCTVIYRDSMIERRSTVFPYNSLEYFETYPFSPAKGMSAVWSERQKVCLIKYYPELKSTMVHQDFAVTLLQPRSTPEGKDKFVEVHISGELTLRAFRTVKVPKPKPESKQSRSIVRHFIDRIAELIKSEQASPPHYNYIEKACRENAVELIYT